MENYNEMNNSAGVLPNTFVANVFMWMFAALGITALVAYGFGTNDELISMLFTIDKNGASLNIFGWIVMLAPLAIVFIMSRGMERMSASTMVFLFIVYSVLMGMSLSFIFLIYTGASIAKTFAVTSAMFGLMAFMGYTTKTDLTKFGSFLLMGLFGIIIASLVNMFMHSAKMDYIISFLGVLIFTGLTAYDVQKIKQIGMMGIDNNETMTKISISAALSLYLDFINLFLYLLRFLGRRK